jgi:nucleoside recognition membrane protein YjiH
MFLQSIFQWWYTVGWASKWRGVLTKVSEQAEAFSLGIILKTLFKPWKQISTLDQHSSWLQKSIDCLISRFVGLLIRTMVLIGGVLFMTVSLLINFTLAIIWPVLPIMPLMFAAIGLGLL